MTSPNTRSSDTVPHLAALKVTRGGMGLLAFWLLCSVAATLSGCGRNREISRRSTVAAAVTQTSASCRECHQVQYKAWENTDHALANRPVASTDAVALAGLISKDASAKAEFVLGSKPLWQPLIPIAGGRWQPHEMAYDPVRQEWFNVFGQEARRPGEWGHWTGRGMNWNSMCAPCHMTGYERRYDVSTDAYRSAWVEHGVGCIQCHGPVATGHGEKSESAPAGPRPPFFGDRVRMMETCAPCHARNELLTDRFQPGDAYHDHYRVVLPVDSATFYPDGQQRDEDFNWTSVLLSRMGHAGVTCFDCHDAHSTKTILPITDNQLCQQCHAAPGRALPSGKVAIAIDPVKHSHHQPGSAGNSCVACHMPTTTYMQRAPRHDHGWLKPDPLLTRELGIPNACSRCHEDKGIDWTIARADEWYGTKLDSRQRNRARAIAAAQADAPKAAEGLLALLTTEDVPAWRATYLSLLSQTEGAAVGREAALASLRASDPLERSAAVRYLTGAPDAGALLTPLLQDPVRLVRLDAEWALSKNLAPRSPERHELDEYLAITLDQPSGHFRLGQDLANRGDEVGAEKEMALAAQWDPFAPPIREAHGMVLAALGRSAEAGAELLRAAELSGKRGGSSAFRAGLAFAEANQPSEAERAFRLAVESEPSMDRAWYNLGLLYAQTDRLSEAADALRAAERISPRASDYPFALATVLLRMGDRIGAHAAALRALQIDPAHPGAQRVFRSTGP